MARSGFPWLCVDMEHAAIDWALASTMFGFIAEAGCVPLCRVPNGTHENIKRALDAGAWGIVAPMVDTVRVHPARTAMQLFVVYDRCLLTRRKSKLERSLQRASTHRRARARVSVVSCFYFLASCCLCR